MRSSLVVRASDCQCTSCNGTGFDPSIRRHSGIWGAADEAVLNIVRTKQKNPPKKKKKKNKICNFFVHFCAGQKRKAVGQKASPQIIARSLTPCPVPTAIATAAKSSPAAGQQHRGLRGLESGPCAGFYLLHGSGQVRSLPQTTFVAGVFVDFRYA